MSTSLLLYIIYIIALYFVIHSNFSPWTGQTFGRVFKYRSGCERIINLIFYAAEQPNLKLKTWSKQLLGYLPLDIIILG
jgi:hypothetical protein